MPQYYHIYPDPDLVAHTLFRDSDEPECICNPHLEHDPESGLVFVIHDALHGDPRMVNKTTVSQLKEHARFLERQGLL
jgi:hypothetical protein